MIDSISPRDLPENSHPVQPSVPPMLLTVPEVAVRLQISSSSVYLLIERGLLPHHRIGARRGAIRITEADLTAYLLACREGASPPPISSTMEPRQPSALKHLKL